MPSNVFAHGAGFAARVTVAGRQVWLGTHETREDAERVVQAYRLSPLDVRDLTVAGWLRRWELLPGRSEVTVAHTRAMLAGFVREYGDLAMVAVSPALAERWVAEHPAHGRYLHTVFRDAVKRRVLPFSPFKGLTPAPSQSIVVAPSEQVTRALVQSARRHGGVYGQSFTLAAAFSGARLGELALLEARHVRVTESGSTRLWIEHGKRVRGEWRPREIVLFEPAAAVLREWAPDVGRLWPRVHGKPLDSAAVLDGWWRRARREVGVQVKFHALRHFCATWLLDKGAAPIDVAVQLGHFDQNGRPDDTLVKRVYGHLDRSAALGRLEALA